MARPGILAKEEMCAPSSKQATSIIIIANMIINAINIIIRTRSFSGLLTRYRKF